MREKIVAEEGFAYNTFRDDTAEERYYLMQGNSTVNIFADVLTSLIIKKYLIDFKKLIRINNVQY